MPHFALHRRNFIPLFYGVSEIFLRPRKIPYEFAPASLYLAYFSPPELCFGVSGHSPEIGECSPRTQCSRGRQIPFFPFVGFTPHAPWPRSLRRADY